MKNSKVLLFHLSNVEHYRLLIYEYFFLKFLDDGIDFHVVSYQIDEYSDIVFKFPHTRVGHSIIDWMRIVINVKPSHVIVFSGLRNYYILPFILILKLFNIKVIYWGHGINLSKKNSFRFLYNIYHKICDKIVLYADHLIEFVDKSFHHKVIIARNTLCINNFPVKPNFKERLDILSFYGIKTTKNIIFVGRMQVRKKIDSLLNAHKLMNRKDVGLVLVGPDNDNVLPKKFPPNVVYIPSLYGADLYKLLMISDIYCCPGSVGLNIVDAMACGLPFVTCQCEHGPEITYLKPNINGILLSENNEKQLSDVLVCLLDDNERRIEMSNQSLKTYINEASIDNMYDAFKISLFS